ncbi:NUDIX hydrolase [Nonomuraea sp. NPDC005983]|uniref:NUDIX hydrolase n=1 Tax=Nonomuraea sp. NPDC005983 TaxID=3155595 RepID=UPI0033A09E76
MAFNRVGDLAVCFRCAVLVDQRGAYGVVSHPLYEIFQPFQACVREVQEELGIQPRIGDLLVVDWAPHPKEGDKILFIFDGGILSPELQSRITFPDGELSGYDYHAPEELDGLLIERSFVRPMPERRTILIADRNRPDLAAPGNHADVQAFGWDLAQRDREPETPLFTREKSTANRDLAIMVSVRPGHPIIHRRSMWHRGHTAAIRDAPARLEIN